MTEQSTAATPTTDAAADATSGSSAAATTTNTVLGETAPATDATTTDAASKAVADKAAADAAAEAEKPVLKAPEKYEFKAPDGFQLEPATTAQFETLARKLDLSNEQANELLPLGAQLAQKIGEQQLAAHQAQVAQWADDTRNDKDIGGAKFDASVATAKKAMDRFGSAPLKQLMDQTGLGNHPEVIRAFHRIGLAIAEDTFVNADSSGGSKRSAADRMFNSSEK
jgi:hypothetical protein